MNIAANAPPFFRNTSDRPARLLCMCTPAGQEEFFVSVSDPVSSRIAPLPTLHKDERAERVQKRKGTRGQIPNGTSDVRGVVPPARHSVAPMPDL